MRYRQDHLAERLQDDDFRKAYEDLETEFEIAEMLIEYRNSYKMTQDELAKLIKINRSDLSKLESGSANPTLKTLKKIASVLGMKLKFVKDKGVGLNQRDSSDKKIKTLCLPVSVNDANSNIKRDYSVSLDKQDNERYVFSEPSSKKDRSIA